MMIWPKAVRPERTVFDIALERDISNKFMSWEKRLVVTPLSVVVKYLKGARMRALTARRCKAEPPAVTIIMLVLQIYNPSVMTAIIWSIA